MTIATRASRRDFLRSTGGVILGSGLAAAMGGNPFCMAAENNPKSKMRLGLVT